MRMTRIDWILLPILVGVLAGVVVGTFLLAGFLGLGILGLIVGVMAQRIELEKDGAVSNDMTTSLYAAAVQGAGKHDPCREGGTPGGERRRF